VRVCVCVCVCVFVSVVILCGSEHFIRDFMLGARELGMTDGEYVYVVAAQVPAQNVHTPWINGLHEDEDQAARLAFQSVLQVSTTQPPILYGTIRHDALVWRYDTIRYDTRCYFNVRTVRSKADISQLNQPR